MIYVGKFNGIAHARNFSSKYEGQRKCYSVKMTPSGIGQRAQVTIEKTKVYFEYELSKFTKYKKEVSEIEKALKLFEK
jgi:hypothetical protein